MLLDLLTQDPAWSSWSRTRLAEALDRCPVVVNQVVYGEVAHRFSTIEALDEVLTPDRLTPDRLVRGNLPWAAAFLAGAHRHAGSTSTACSAGGGMVGGCR